jgi:hypothetical protein
VVADVLATVAAVFQAIPPATVVHGVASVFTPIPHVFTSIEPIFAAVAELFAAIAHIFATIPHIFHAVADAVARRLGIRRHCNGDYQYRGSD